MRKSAEIIKDDGYTAIYVFEPDPNLYRIGYFLNIERIKDWEPDFVVYSNKTKEIIEAKGDIFRLLIKGAEVMTAPVIEYNWIDV